MSERRYAAVALAVVATAALVVLGGCGEKAEPETAGPVVAQTTAPTTTQPTTGQTTTGQDPGRSDQQLVVEAAMSFLSSPDAAAVCDSGVTPALLGSVYGDRAGCLAARKPQSLAKSAQFSGIQVGQGTATLTADARGGVYGSGQKLQMSVVSDATGTWRVDKVKSNVPVGP